MERVDLSCDFNLPRVDLRLHSATVDLLPVTRKGRIVVLAQQSTRVRKKMRCSRKRSVARLRGEFFAKAGEPASRYGISFERLMHHMWEARTDNRRLLLRHVTHIEDLVHAVACIDGRSLAWNDLAERYERTLIRRCRGDQDEIAATILIRRFFADLRHDNAQPGSIPAARSLRGYFGNRPLRNWLSYLFHGARALGQFERQWHRHEVTALRDGTCDRPWPMPFPDHKPLRFDPSKRIASDWF
jgi:hypothetical protein